MFTELCFHFTFALETAPAFQVLTPVLPIFSPSMQVCIRRLSQHCLDMSEREKGTSKNRDLPAFLRPESVQPLSVPSKEMWRSSDMAESPVRSALARQGSMSRLHGPRQAGSPIRSRKSVSFDYHDEVIQYDAPTPEPRFTPDCDASAYEFASHPLPSLPPMAAEEDAEPVFEPKVEPTTETKVEIESDDSLSHVTLGWDDEVQMPASPNPLMAELDKNRSKLSKRVDAIMEEGPELAKKPFVRHHNAHPSWGSQSSLLKEGLLAVAVETDQASDTEEMDDGNDNGHHLDRLPSLIRQESLIESQRRPPTIRMTDKELPAPAEVQRTYSQRRHTLLKMLDSNKPEVPDMIAEEEEEEEEEERDLSTCRGRIPVSTSSYDLFDSQARPLGIDPGSPERESAQDILRSMSPVRTSDASTISSERPLPKLPELTQPNLSPAKVETSPVLDENPKVHLDIEPGRGIDSGDGINLQPVPKSNLTPHQAEPEPEAESEMPLDADTSEESLTHVDLSFERAKVVDIPPSPVLADLDEPVVGITARVSQDLTETQAPAIRQIDNESDPVGKSPTVSLDGLADNIVPETAFETLESSPHDLSLDKENPPAPQLPVFAPIDLGDTPNLDTISSSPFAISTPSTPATFAQSPTQAELERRRFVEEQAELIRRANSEAMRMDELPELTEAADVEVSEPSSSPELIEKKSSASPALEPPHLDSDLSDSGMSSPELAGIAEQTEQVEMPAELPAVRTPELQPAAEIAHTAPSISTSTLSIETGDTLQLGGEFEELLTPRRGYTVRESPTYIMASSPARQRSTPVRRNGALEIGAGPRLPQAASCGQISQVSPRRLPQSASASPVRVPEHRRPRPVWAAPALREEAEPESEAKIQQTTVPSPVFVNSPNPQKSLDREISPPPAPRFSSGGGDALTGPVLKPKVAGPREPLTSVATPPLREQTPPLIPRSASTSPSRSPVRTFANESEIRVPRVRPSREMLADYKQLPPVEPSTPRQSTPTKNSLLLYDSPAVKPKPGKFAGRVATSPSESGRLFIRVDKVVSELPDVANRSATVWLDLDNGEHCIATPEIQVTGDTAQFGKEYELVVGPENHAVITARIKWSTPTLGSTLLSKLRRKSTTADSDWQHLVTADGAFGRCTLKYNDMSSKAFGAPTPVVAHLVNEWAGDTQSAGQVHLTALFVPRMSVKETLPGSMAEAVRDIEMAQKQAVALKSGSLIVNGRRRWCVVDDASLVVYSEQKRPRASFNLAKASTCSLHDASIYLTFRTGDVLTLEVEKASVAEEWAQALSRTIASPTLRSPWLNLILYR